MEILAHRGYWNQDIIPNSEEAIEMALKKGYGFETDIRDYMGRLVISHNIAGSSAIDAEIAFEQLARYQGQRCLAINIKSDGLKELLKEILKKYRVSNYFCFDMSIPQMVEFHECELTFFTRQSEFEQQPCMYDQAAGIWIDGFNNIDWITELLLQTHIQNGKKICIVSPELHGNLSYKNFWENLNGYNLNFSKVLLCTDYPDLAKEFFSLRLEEF